MVAVATIAAVGAMSSAGAGASVATKAKEVSEEKYAKTMCTAYNTVIDDLGDFTADLTASSNSQTDPAAFQTEVASSLRPSSRRSQPANGS